MSSQGERHQLAAELHRPLSSRRLHCPRGHTGPSGSARARPQIVKIFQENWPQKSGPGVPAPARTQQIVSVIAAVTRTAVAQRRRREQARRHCHGAPRRGSVRLVAGTPAVRSKRWDTSETSRAEPVGIRRPRYEDVSATRALASSPRDSSGRRHGGTTETSLVDSSLGVLTPRSMSV